MKTIEIPYLEPSERQLSQICDAIEDGQIVILPTDTIYAICCNALSQPAIERLCKIKHINPEKTNLSIICSDLSQASEYAKIDNSAFRIIKGLVPGPFTFLLRSVSTLPKAFKGRKTVGVRIPDNSICRSVAERLGHPILTTSIQFDSEDYAVSPGLIAENYQSMIDLFVDTGDGDTIPSTIIDCRDSEPVIVRQGKGEI